MENKPTEKFKHPNIQRIECENASEREKEHNEIETKQKKNNKKETAQQNVTLSCQFEDMCKLKSPPAAKRALPFQRSQRISQFRAKYD